MALRLSKELRAETTTPVNEETRGSSKGFDLTINPGENYDLDKIVSERDRQNSDEVLVAHVEDRADSSEELLAHVDDVENQTFDYGKTGELTVDRKEGDRKIKIKSTSVDYKKYLLDGKLNSPSTPGWTPLVTGRRPVIIWQEGTQDDREETDNESVYDKVLEIAEKLKLNEEKLDSIEIDHNKYLNKDSGVASLIERQKEVEGWPIRVENVQGKEYRDEKEYRKLVPNVGAVLDLVKNYVNLDEIEKPKEFGTIVYSYIENETLITEDPVIREILNDSFYEVDEPTLFDLKRIENKNNMYELVK